MTIYNLRKQKQFLSNDVEIALVDILARGKSKKIIREKLMSNFYSLPDFEWWKDFHVVKNTVIYKGSDLPKIRKQLCDLFLI